MRTTTGAGATATLARRPEPPFLRGHPLWGSMREFQRAPLEFVREAGRRGELVRYRMAHMTWYQVNHPEGVRRVLQERNHDYGKGTLTAGILKPVLGEGLLISEGETWLRQRRLMQPVFHRQSVAAFGELMTAATLETLERWEPLARRDEPFDAQSEMTCLGLEIVTAALFSSHVGAKREAISSAISTLIEDVSYRFEVPFYPPLSVPTPRNRRMRAALRTLDAAMYQIIQEHRDREDASDLLSLLMAARDPETGEAMSDRQLRDEVITLFIAGHETTANALTWVWYLLARNPEAERCLHAELDTVLGDRLPTVADLPALPYTRMVLDEALRLYPPAWITNRQARVDDEIRGYRIPAGSIVMISPYVVHRLPDLWERPDEFEPERFSPERSAGRPRFAYFPFGGGPRQCIGKAMALTEAQLVLATIARRYRVRLAADRPVEPQALATLCPRDGLWVVAESVDSGAQSREPERSPR